MGTNQGTVSAATRHRRTRAAAASLAAVGLLVGACTGSTPSDGVVDPTSPSPTPDQVVEVATSLPTVGVDAESTRSTNQMLRLYLEQQGGQAGDFTVRLVESTGVAPSGVGTGEDSCRARAALHAARPAEVALIGTLDADCARVQVPILNEAPDGPLTLVSHAVTYPGLTVPWETGEPDVYYPDGRRNFARVVTTDEQQGAALAAYAGQNLEVQKCAVINDGRASSQAQVVSFVDGAETNGIEVLGSDTWDPASTSYTDFFTAIAAKEPDCLVIAGSWVANGAQLLRDKVAVLGDNREVKVLTTSAFLGETPISSVPEAAGAAVPQVGWSLDELVGTSPEAATLVRDYRLRYGEAPASADALYAVAALQVVLKAIAASDGTRAGVTAAVIGGRGLTVPAEESVLGRTIRIDPTTGDVNLKDFTVYRLVDGRPAIGTPVSLGS